MSRTSRRPMGSSALVGSSSSSSRGPWMSAWATPRRCFMPRENPPTRVLTPVSPASSSMASTRCRARCRRGRTGCRRSAGTRAPSSTCRRRARRAGSRSALRASAPPPATSRPEDPDDAGVRVREAGEDAQCGRLAGAVGPEEAVDGAVRHAQREAVERDRVAEGLAYGAELDGRAGGRCAVPARAPVPRRARRLTADVSARGAASGGGTAAPGERVSAAGAGRSRPTARYTIGPMSCSSRHRMSQGILLPPLICDEGRR